MAASVEDLTNLFVGEIEADGNTDFVMSIIAAARRKIDAGKGYVTGALTSASENGKSWQRAEIYNPVQVLAAARAALKIAAGEDDQVSTTYPDFSGMTR